MRSRSVAGPRAIETIGSGRGRIGRLPGRCGIIPQGRFPMKNALLLLAIALVWKAEAQDADVSKKLEGFDDYMAMVLKDWNGPGIGVGIVVGDKLVFAKGYGYRDYEKKLPFTPGTVCPI